MVNLVLDYLSSTIQLDPSAALYTQAIYTLDVSAVAVLEVSLTAMKSIFKILPDGNTPINIYTITSPDTKYYVNSTLWPVLNPANAMMDHNLSSGTIAMNDSNGQPLDPTKQLLCNDFLRYLALSLFNTHYGVDLFSNERAMLNDIKANCGSDASGCTWYDVTSKINAVGLYGTHQYSLGPDNIGRFMTNYAPDNTNLCRVLTSQILSADPDRFVGLSNNGTPMSLPFLENDSINFKLTVLPAPGQELLTGVAPIGPRSYEIKLLMKSAPLNTV